MERFRPATPRVAAPLFAVSHREATGGEVGACSAAVISWLKLGVTLADGYALPALAACAEIGSRRTPWNKSTRTVVSKKSASPDWLGRPMTTESRASMHCSG